MKVSSALRVMNLPIAARKSKPHNARTHSKHQIRKIGESIKTLGFTNPILLDVDKTIIAGNGRLVAAELLGIAEAPTIDLKGRLTSSAHAHRGRS